MTCLNGRYLLRREIGRGGMATVWHADDLLLQRPVAVKMLHRALSGDPLVRDRVRHEALAAAALNHPHIANVYDYGEHRDDDDTPHPYLVMELVDGPTLDMALAGAGRLPWRRATQIVAAVADALTAAHAHGVVHRDIKPGNVILGATGVKVVDFGIAASVGQDATDANGVVWGTPAYLPPESTRDTVATSAGDVYALGLLLAVCLTGHLPHRDVSGQADLAPDSGDTATDLPPRARDLLAALLAPDPADRPTAAVAARELHAVTTSTTTKEDGPGATAAALSCAVPGTTTVVPRVRQRQLRRPAMFAGSGLALATTVVVAAQAVSVGDPADAGNDTAIESALSCAADYVLRWRPDGTFTARLNVTNTGDKRLTTWTIRFDLPAGQHLTAANGATWVQQRRAITLTTDRRPAPDAGITAVMLGTADSAQPSVPRRFTVNDEACSRVDTRTLTSARNNPLPSARQPDRATAAGPTTPHRSAAVRDTSMPSHPPTSDSTPPTTPASSEAVASPSPYPTATATDPPDPAPTPSEPTATPTRPTKPTPSVTPSPTPTGSPSASAGSGPSTGASASTTAKAPRPPTSPAGPQQSKERAGAAAGDRNGGRTVPDE